MVETDSGSRGWGMDRAAETARRSDAVKRGYQAETRELIARRVSIATAALLSCMGLGGAIEWAYAPERLDVFAQTFFLCLTVCLLHLAVARGARRWALAATLVASNALALGISSYFARVHGSAELAVASLAVFLAGLAMMYPWGLFGQLGASLGALCGYPLLLWAGARLALPAPFGLFALLTVAAMMAVGAYLTDRLRFAVYRDTMALAHANAVQRHEQELTGVLLRLADALSMTIADAQALADQLAAHTRQALRADWVILYSAAERDRDFRVAAVQGAPRAVSDDLRTFGFQPEHAPRLYDELERNGAVEIGPDPDPNMFPGALMRRWKVTAALVQSISCDDRIIGVLACGYCGWRGPFADQQRRLLAAIARQAAVALDNARLMEETQAAHRVKSEFVSTVSHEVRTPLNVIVGYTNLLIDGVFGAPPPEQLSPLECIAEQSTQLLDLIQGMLDLNRIEAGQIRLILEEFNIGDLIQSVRAGIPASWQKRGVHLRWDTAHNTILIRSDRVKLELILRNLIQNGLKYTEEGTVAVEVQPHAPTRQVTFAVSDTGAGIAAGDLPGIFDPFRQGSNGSIRAGGMGLGLYVVKRLTEALGGEIRVDSQPGMGARFTLSLPASARGARWAARA
ncbi:MAG: hypothetical protein A3J75_02950 [Acidobacteria bacterium RBG_16_68_9]|nr:MAG: hypothetical protein A3J75_02950 [Acidobacteria bacterium RBG_16_68_9]